MCERRDPTVNPKTFLSLRSGENIRVCFIESLTVCVSTYTVPSPPAICFSPRLPRSHAFPAAATLTVV